jgi:hypothetical protein
MEINATLEIKDLWTPAKQSQDDQFIMTAFTDMKATRAELVVLNNWRIYYRVLLFSELCFSSGQGIQPVYLEYNHDTLVRQSSTTLNWPIQDKPDVASFKIWSMYIRLCFTNSENKRTKQIGAWNVAEVIRTSPRHGYYSHRSKEIYIPVGKDSYNTHQAFEIKRMSGRYDPNQVKKKASELPKDAIPEDFYEYPESIFFKFALPTAPVSEPKKHDNMKWRNKILHHLIIEDISTLQQAMMDPKITVNIVSDGGNKVNLKINDKYINSHYPKIVNLAFHSIALREHYATKYGWSAKTIDSLWWPVYFQSLAKLADPDKSQIQKFVNNRMPALYREQKYYKKATSTGYCKQCRLYNENEDHIIRCRIPSRQKIWDEWRKELTTFLSESHTPVAIRNALCHEFFNWLESGRNTLGIPPLPNRSNRSNGSIQQPS